MKRKKTVTLILAVLIIVIIVSLVSCNGCEKAVDPTEDPEPEVTATPEAVESPETDKVTEEIEDKEELTPDPTATTEPTAEPTATPTAEPTAAPTAEPTAAPVAGGNGTTPTQQPQAPQATATPAPAAKPTEAPKPTTAPTAKPAETHTHDWQDVTKTVHHDAVTEEKWVVDVPATDPWTEDVKSTVYICRCGATFNSQAGVYNHQSQYFFTESQDDHQSYSVDIIHEYIYHEGTPEVGHYETVIVTAAWDETVVTGQKCTTCGATK